jgi:hypothetical protein
MAPAMAIALPLDHGTLPTELYLSHSATDTHAIIEVLLETAYLLYPSKELQGQLQSCGGEFEFFHHGPMSRGGRRKGNPVPVKITASRSSWGYKYWDVALQAGRV